MADRRPLQLSELDKLPPDMLYTFLDEIPSDLESDIGDYSDDDEIPEMFENKQIQDFMEGDEELIEKLQNDDMSDGWESEDEIPLIRLQSARNRTIVCSRGTENCTNVNACSSNETGSNIPEDIETPVEVFLQLFPPDLISHLVFHTNLYSMQNAGGNQARFVPANDQEMKVFLAINLIMGIKHQPSYRDYWSANEQLRDTYVSSLMSRDRFTWYLSNLHINDNNLQPTRTQPNFDKLYKVRPLLDKLGQTFLTSLRPSEQQAIDESMIRFKGRSSLRQYMPMKPVKRGYKVWVRADKTGYMCEFQIYTGKLRDSVEKNLGKRVVMDLTTTLVGKYHKVYFDNFFNSVELQQELLQNRIYACGTARKGRRNMPTDLRDDKFLNRGDCDYRVSNDGIVCLKWMDKKGVLFLDNFHNPSDNRSVFRKQKDGTQEEISCPELVKDYNSNMGYVDKFDMLKSCYEIDRKSHKWWHRIFFYFLDACIVNSFVIFQQRLPSSTTLKDFRLSVVSGLVGAGCQSRQRGRKPESKPVNRFKIVVPLEKRYDQNKHMPARSTSLRCAQCSSRHEPHRSMWKCSTCNVGLCLNDKRNCFELYHKK